MNGPIDPSRAHGPGSGGSAVELDEQQAQLHERLRTAPLSVLGQLLDSSNTTLLTRLEDGGDEHVIYKPVAGKSHSGRSPAIGL